MLILQEKAEKRANQSSCLLILVGTVLYLQSTRAQYKLLLCSNTVPHRAEVNFFSEFQLWYFRNSSLLGRAFSASVDLPLLVVIPLPRQS